MTADEIRLGRRESVADLRCFTRLHDASRCCSVD